MKTDTELNEPAVIDYCLIGNVNVYFS